MRIILLAFLLALYKVHAVREYEISFNVPAEHRYDQVIADYYYPLHSLIDTGLATLSSWQKWLIDFVSNYVYNWFEILLEDEYAAEIQGISVAANVPAFYIFALNAMYELVEQCTSIVSRDTTGHITLARNLDVLYADHLRKLNVALIYTKDGHELFKCSGLAGSIGMLTCVKPGQYAISLNARDLYQPLSALWSAVRGRPTVTWLIRTTLMTAQTYTAALELFTTRPSISGSYIIIAGTQPNEGAVITRGRDGAVHTTQLNETAWYLAQCNVDPWVAPDERTVITNEWMREMGQDGISLGRIAEDILMQPPVFRDNTIATILMDPATGYLLAYVPAKGLQ